MPLALPPEAEQLILAGTSHVAVIDAGGNAVAMTVTNNLNFGARVAPIGFTLNNGLSNFASDPAAANAMAPGKRPATTMAPIIVFGAEGRPEIVAGAGGGAWIIDAVAVGLADMLVRGAGRGGRRPAAHRRAERRGVPGEGQRGGAAGSAAAGAGPCAAHRPGGYRHAGAARDAAGHRGRRRPAAGWRRPRRLKRPEVLGEGLNRSALVAAATRS